MMFLQKMEGVRIISAAFVLLAMALLGLFSQAPARTDVTTVTPTAFTTVETPPAERPPEVDDAKPTISPEIELVSSETTGVIMPVAAAPNFAHAHDPRLSAVDFPEGCYSPIRASLGGVVREAYSASGWGLTALVDHENGTQARYAHASSLAVSAGQRVAQGDILGYVGNTGESDGCHLHVETYGATAWEFFSGAVPTTAAPAPAEAPAVTPAPTQSGPDWDRLAMCESSGNWSINTGNGYYGAYQFDIPTWNEYGGQKYAARADMATPEQQTEMANHLWTSRGANEDAAIRSWPGCTRGNAAGWWQGGGSPVEPPAPAPAEDTFVEQAPVQTIPEVAPVQEPVVETLPAPAQTWVEEQVESLPEPVQAPVQQWIEQQVTPTPAPAYVAPVAELPTFDAAPAPSASAFDANAVVDAVNDFVDNNPALGNNPAIAGAVAQLPGLLGIH